METKKKTLKISFSTPKGGVGKSTMTALLSSVLHYRLAFNVLVMDCDFPQHSLANMRERDLKTIMQNDYHKRAAMKLYQSINKKTYPIISCKPEDALSKALEYVNQSAIEPDITFFDLPGTANTKGVLTTLRTMDFIFSPISADRLVMETGIYEAYQSVINELDLSVMNSRIMDSKRFRKETDDTPNSVFRSSLLPAEPQLMKVTRLDLFIEEFLKIVNL